MSTSPLFGTRLAKPIGAATSTPASTAKSNHMDYQRTLTELSIPEWNLLRGMVLGWNLADTTGTEFMMISNYTKKMFKETVYEVRLFAAGDKHVIGTFDFEISEKFTKMLVAR